MRLAKIEQEMTVGELTNDHNVGVHRQQAAPQDRT